MSPDKEQLGVFSGAVTLMKGDLEAWTTMMTMGDPALVNLLVLVDAATNALQAAQVLLREALHTWPDSVEPDSDLIRRRDLDES